MTEAEIRAKALEMTVAAAKGGQQLDEGFWKVVSIFEVYIRDGAEAIQGMVKRAAG